MAKCLVTGGCGFIGSWVVDLLVENDHEVTVLDNLSTGKSENLNPKAELIRGSITKPSKFGLIGEVDYVFHLASLARIQPSIDDPINSHKTNVNGTLNVLEYCRKHNAKLIFSSSSSIYEGSRLPSREESAVEPKNPYALQKYICEQYIELYAQLYGLQYTILRYFNVFGERQILQGAYAAVVGIFLDQKKKNIPLTITGDGEQRRDFTYVKDVARANLLAMKWRGTLNVGTGKNNSINEIADFVDGKKIYTNARHGEVKETLANITKARRLGFYPTITIEEWISAN